MAAVFNLPSTGNPTPDAPLPKARAKRASAKGVEMPTAKVAHSSRGRGKVSQFNKEVVGAVFLGTVALALMALSLTHLAHGITIVTACPVWEAWALAIGIDLGFVGFEVRKITASKSTLDKIGSALNYAILGTLAGSAALNALAFGHNAEGLFIYPAALFGLCIPALVYFCTRFGTVSWLD